MQAESLDVASEYEALLQFLYISPVGLAQITGEGEIVMMNPVSSQLLMPLSCDGGLNNLFTALQDFAPDLRHQVSSYRAPRGAVCDGLRVELGPFRRSERDPQVLSLTLLKLDSNRLMAVLHDITQQVKHERLLRQNEAWFNAIIIGVTDYARGASNRGMRASAASPDSTAAQWASPTRFSILTIASHPTASQTVSARQTKAAGVSMTAGASAPTVPAFGALR